MLPGHRGKVVGLVVGHLPGPEDEDDLEPLRGERPDGVVMAVPTLPAPVIVRARPLALAQRLEGELVDGLAQVHVAGEAELDAHLLAAAVGDGDGAGVPLEMPERLPAAGGVAELGIELRHGRAAPAAGQGRGALRRRHAGEKIGHRLAIGLSAVTVASSCASSAPTSPGQPKKCRRWASTQLVINSDGRFELFAACLAGLRVAGYSARGWRARPLWNSRLAASGHFHAEEGQWGSSVVSSASANRHLVARLKA